MRKFSAVVGPAPQCKLAMEKRIFRVVSFSATVLTGWIAPPFIFEQLGATLEAPMSTECLSVPTECILRVVLFALHVQRVKRQCGRSALQTIRPPKSAKFKFDAGKTKRIPTQNIFIL